MLHLYCPPDGHGVVVGGPSHGVSGIGGVEELLWIDYFQVAPAQLGHDVYQRDAHLAIGDFLHAQGRCLLEHDHELLEVHFRYHSHVLKVGQDLFLTICGETTNYATTLQCCLVLEPISARNEPWILFLGVSCQEVEDVLELNHIKEFL